MADKKISQLPLTAAVNADDTMEKSSHNAAPSERYTPAQMATFMQTAMALVQLSGGNIKLNADGSASFAGVKILFNADGSCTFASANAGFAADGALNLPLSHLLADGSAQFANGNANIAAAGDASFDQGAISLGGGGLGACSFANGASTLAADGSASFANGQTILSATGGMSLIDGLSVGNSTTVIQSDGSANLANGACNLAADGSLTVDNGSGSVKLNSATGGIDISGTQVVTAQQPAIADATNAVDVITQFNTLLAELRTHGLIAP